jgi:hypothetical protein
VGRQPGRMPRRHGPGQTADWALTRRRRDTGRRRRRSEGPTDTRVGLLERGDHGEPNGGREATYWSPE